jgi:hypothetical protein
VDLEERIKQIRSSGGDQTAVASSSNAPSPRVKRKKRKR